MTSLEPDEGYFSDIPEPIAAAAVGALQHRIEVELNDEARAVLANFQRRRAYPVVVGEVSGLFELVLCGQYYRIYSVQFNVSLEEARALYPIHNAADAFHINVEIRVEPYILPVFLVIHADGSSWRVIYRRRLALEERRRGARLEFNE
ncbi:hypothetical protein QAD02_020972 [Eretmocerus hayati]|uniref:Uncharacterized protein n=1 Tax=Eretmocerus hayati TaxID=131215 RepID=A0ACC2PNL5_9HYME|nr:hypothetical protein QAD02_020972 [Eretmocerus hayati]